MEQVKSVLTQTNYRPLSTIKPAPATDYDNAKIEDRRWEVVYGYGKEARKFLTDEERRYFLGELSQGKTMVQVGGLTLTNRFLYIAPLRDKKEQTEYELVEVNGEQVYREK
jgi:hypothetical protein